MDLTMVVGYGFKRVIGLYLSHMFWQKPTLFPEEGTMPLHSYLTHCKRNKSEIDKWNVFVLLPIFIVYRRLQ